MPLSFWSYAFQAATYLIITLLLLLIIRHYFKNFLGYHPITKREIIHRPPIFSHFSKIQIFFFAGIHMKLTFFFHWSTLIITPLELC